MLPGLFAGLESVRVVASRNGNLDWCVSTVSYWKIQIALIGAGFEFGKRPIGLDAGVSVT